jgi:hypothetical protein
MAVAIPMMHLMQKFAVGPETLTTISVSMHINSPCILGAGRKGGY